MEYRLFQKALIILVEKLWFQLMNTGTGTGVLGRAFVQVLYIV